MPIVRDLEQDGTASFHFIHGDVETTPPNGFFGSAPHLRFAEHYCGTSTDQEFYDKICNAPHQLTPEQKYRELLHSSRPQSNHNGQKISDRLHGILINDGPFDGIIGYSEGASMAASLVIDYLRKCAQKEIPVSLKCAVFMSGGPPPLQDGTGLILADDHGQIITMPTCHIMGYNDPLIDGVLALYHVCDQASATIVDHGNGHLLPRDPISSRLMIRGIRDLIIRAKISTPK